MKLPRRWFERHPAWALVTVVAAATMLLLAALEAWLTVRFEGLQREQHAYLKILDGPLYADVPDVGAIRDIWAGVDGTNACGPDRLDIRYADYYLYAPAPFCNPVLTIDGPHGERATVNPESAAFEIWVFGGSTILDVGAVDADTIPSQLSARLNADLPAGVRVRNFGVSGFQSTQERTRFFEILRTEASPPAIVAFYDGFNEAVRSQEPRPGAIPADLTSKVVALVEKRHATSLRYAIGGALSRFYTFTELLHPAWRALRGGPGPVQAGLAQDEIARRLDAGVENYLHNLRMVRAVAGAYGVDAHFFWQPMLFTKPHPGAHEEPHLPADWVAYWDPIFRAFYDRVLTDRRLRARDDFHDLTGVFDDVREDVFRDYGHLVPRGNAIVAAAMASILIDSPAWTARSAGAHDEDSAGRKR